MARQQWLDFLVSQGAKSDNGQITYFTNSSDEIRAANETNVISDLSPLGLIKVQGEEATGFLQNQTSNDIKEISATKSHLSAYCNAKGRVLSLFRVFQRDNNYYLRLPLERIDATVNRLRMFILMTAATVDDAGEELVSMGVSGPDAATKLSEQGFTVPKLPDQVATENEITLIRVYAQSPRFEVIGPLEKIQSLWQQLSSWGQVTGYPAWLNLDIKAGIPQIDNTTTEDFVPQMINLQNLEGISFTKGCYPGQEVVARMHYLGKQKRRMYRAHANADTLPQPGDNLYTDNNTPDQSVGKIVSAVTAAEGGADILAVLQIKNAEAHTIRLNSASGIEVSLKDLPYSVEVEGS